MNIKNLTLHNFRNYKDENIEFNNGINILSGSNGQGKTNILEGIYYLITGKSHRIKSENELILWDEKDFYLLGNFIINNRKIKIESFYQYKKKIIKINQIPCKRLSDYVGTVNVVFFSPDDLEIIKKGPSERRKFLDLLIIQNRPSHISLLNKYIKVLQQKTGLLKKFSRTENIKEQIEIWNEQIYEIGSAVIKNRWEYTLKLQKYSREIFTKIFSPSECMSLIYESMGKQTLDESIIAFKQLLSDKMEQEIERKLILVGPHRDDLLVEINNKSARLFASQGQQRSLVLCLKLAEMEIIYNIKREYPILLLDDVFSELDKQRKEYLINYVNSLSGQTIITMTGSDLNGVINKNKTLYNVLNGKTRKEE